MRESVKIVSGALDEFGEKKDIIIRGVIHPDSLALLQTAPYQREILPITKIKDIIEAFKVGSVPDIELGMRGDSVRDHDGAFYLQDPVYIIDGLQRRTAALEYLKRFAGLTPPHLGATIHLNTNETWERDRFRILNAHRVKLASDVLYRNAKEDVPAVKTLYNLTHDSKFVMGGKVCWQQRKQRGHLLHGTTYLKTVANLHARFGPGRQHGVEELTRGLQKIADNVGLLNLRDNTRTFFDILEEAYGISTITFSEGAKHLRGSFLHSLANVFARHGLFWRNHTLVVDRDIRYKIKLFPILTDPHVASLAGAAGTARKILYQMLIEHINSGKRSRRLVEDFLHEDAIAAEDTPTAVTSAIV